MKRFLLNFFLGVLCTATMSAANADISRAIPTKNNNENAQEEKSNSTVSASVNRSTVSRNVSRTKPVIHHQQKIQFHVL